MTTKPKSDATPLPAQIIEAALGAAATQVLCTKCGQIEYVMPLEGDDEPFEPEFLASYVCSDCEW